MLRWVLLSMVVACGATDEGPLGVNEVGAEWVELYNGTDSDASLAGFTLTTEEGQRLELGPDLLLGPGEVATVSFTIPSTGTVMRVSDASDTLLQTIDIPPLSSAASFGRVPDGIANWQVIASPTPGMLNAP